MSSCESGWGSKVSAVIYMAYTSKSNYLADELYRLYLNDTDTDEQC